MVLRVTLDRAANSPGLEEKTGPQFALILTQLGLRLRHMSNRAHDSRDRKRWTLLPTGHYILCALASPRSPYRSPGSCFKRSGNTMFSRFCMASVILALLSCGASARNDDGANAAFRPIEGTFIQYEDWMMKLSARDWYRELEAMKNAGIRTVVIVWLRMDNSSSMPRAPWAVDPTAIMLDYAGKNGLRAFCRACVRRFLVQKAR
jgi:hypothetical protein